LKTTKRKNRRVAQLMDSPGSAASCSPVSPAVGERGVTGTSHGGEVATKTAVLGALMIPVFPIAPLVLMSGFRRGENAVLPGGKRFVVYVASNT
jgi:hypothetical protein